MSKIIMVIEDDTDIRETITYALKEEGYEVIASEDARILKNLLNHNPDLILLDNWLSDWKSDAAGHQLSAQIKSDPATSHIPVIIISAVSNIEEIAASGKADSYLRKPFDLNDLLGVVAKYIIKK